MSMSDVRRERERLSGCETDKEREEREKGEEREREKGDEREREGAAGGR